MTIADRHSLTFTAANRQPEPRPGSRLRLTVRFALVFTLIATLCLTGLGFYLYQGSVNALIEGELNLLASTNEAAGARLRTHILFAREDAVYLSQTPPITGIARARANGGVDPEDGSTLDLWESRLTTLFSGILAARPEYLQARYIGLDGNEIVRVNREANGSIVGVPDEALQNKSDRPYFLDTLALAQGEAYISDVDLNVEFGVVEQPIRPVIRTAAPAYDASGELLGIVVVNIDIVSFFDIVAQTVRDEAVHFVTNQMGDYLYHPDPTQSFGFALDNPTRIQDEIPELARLLSIEQQSPLLEYSGMVSLAGNEYVSSARRIRFDPDDPNRYFLLATFWPRSEVAGQIADLRTNSVLAVALLVVLGAAMLSLAARIMTRSLRMMTSAAGEVAAGGRPAELTELARRQDETGDRAVETMLEKVTERENRLGNQAVELKRKVEEQQNTEAALRASEARIGGFLAAVPDALLIVDIKGEILFASKRVETLFGYEAEELIGKPIHALVPERNREAHTHHVAEFQHRPRVRAMGAGKDLQARRKDGTTFPVEVSLAPTKTGDANVTIAAVRDISDRKDVERQLQQAQKMEAVGNLTGGLAHDFNNLLGVIIGNLDMLSSDDGGSEAEARALVDEALEAALQGSELTQNLLAFARRRTLKPKKTDVNEAIDRLAKIVRRTLPQVELVLDLKPSIPSVDVDVAQLEASLLNIFNNARDAMPEGGTLTVSTNTRYLADNASRPDVNPGQYVVVSQFEISGSGLAGSRSVTVS